MVEPPAVVAVEADAIDEPPGTHGSRWRIFTCLVMPGAVLDGLASIAAFLAQTGADADVLGVTALVAAITLSEASGAYMAARVWRNDGRLHLLLLACGAAVFAVSQMVSTGAAAAAVALAFFPGLIGPLRAVALQRVAGDSVRARIASFASACDMACTTLGLLTAGALSTRRKRP
jgi:hypothetical protein